MLETTVLCDYPRSIYSVSNLSCSLKGKGGVVVTKQTLQMLLAPIISGPGFSQYPGLEQPERLVSVMFFVSALFLAEILTSKTTCVHVSKSHPKQQIMLKFIRFKNPKRH
jgi:hypothetical protein